MRKLITIFLLMATFSLSVVQAQETRQYSADEVATLLNDLTAAVDGDVYELTTPGDQGFYKIDSMSLEIWADVTIKAAAGLAVKPKVKLVYNQDYKDAADTSMVDYLVRLRAPKVELNLYKIELQGDTNKTKYGIRTMKLKDVTGADSYKDPDWDEDSVIQNYTLNIVNCDINGIKSGSDGRGLMLYVGTRGNINIDNSVFSAINRDAINMYTDGTRTTANGPFQYVENLIVKNTTFHGIGREAITLRNSGEDASDPANKTRLCNIVIDHCTFDSVGEAAPQDSYYPLRIDAAKVSITNSLMSNMTSKSYVLGSNKNEASMLDYISMSNVMKFDTDNEVAVEFDDVPDAFSFLSASIGENNWLNTLDPKFADRANGDFTLASDSEVLGKASDGTALGAARWAPGYVSADNADLSDITVDGASIEGFDPATTNYTVDLPNGTTEVPMLLATTFSANASYTAVTPTTLPNSMVFTVTSEDGYNQKVYDVYLNVLPPDVSVNDASLDMVSVYPNPSNGTFTVANSEGANLTIYSVTGSVVLSKNNISDNEVISSDLRQGIYFVKVENAFTQKINKIIVE